MSRLKRFVACLIFFITILAAIVFSFNNNTEVPLWIGRELPPLGIGIWIIMAFSLGAVVGLLLGYGLFNRFRYQMKIRQLQAKLKKVEQRKMQ